jgi:hypothetical protein
MGTKNIIVLVSSILLVSTKSPSQAHATSFLTSACSSCSSTMLEKKDVPVLRVQGKTATLAFNYQDVINLMNKKSDPDLPTAFKTIFDSLIKITEIVTPPLQGIYRACTFFGIIKSKPVANPTTQIPAPSTSPTSLGRNQTATTTALTTAVTTAGVALIPALASHAVAFGAGAVSAWSGAEFMLSKSNRLIWNICPININLYNKHEAAIQNLSNYKEKHSMCTEDLAKRDAEVSFYNKSRTQELVRMNALEEEVFSLQRSVRDLSNNNSVLISDLKSTNDKLTSIMIANSECNSQIVYFNGVNAGMNTIITKLKGTDGEINGGTPIGNYKTDSGQSLTSVYMKEQCNFGLKADYLYNSNGYYQYTTSCRGLTEVTLGALSTLGLISVSVITGVCGTCCIGFIRQVPPTQAQPQVGYHSQQQGSAHTPLSRY